MQWIHSFIHSKRQERHFLQESDGHSFLGLGLGLGLRLGLGLGLGFS